MVKNNPAKLLLAYELEIHYSERGFRFQITEGKMATVLIVDDTAVDRQLGSRSAIGRRFARTQPEYRGLLCRKR